VPDIIQIKRPGRFRNPVPPRTPHQSQHAFAAYTIALTAYARQEDHAAALAAGFDAHIARPVAPAELVEAVAKLASRATKG
jgi:CheY-like chemotaxis protein